MNLLQIRQELVKKSGRYDLATTGAEEFDTDTGADYYINAAIKTLDLEQEQGEQVQESSLSAGSSLAAFYRVRQISRLVFLEEDAEVELIRKTFSQISQLYPLLTGTTVGTPGSWAIYAKNSMNPYIARTDILILPPPDAAVTVRAYGRFFSPSLVENTDENYWSIEYPQVLLLAALREIEGINRNTEGYSDYTILINERLFGIDKDLAGTDAMDESLEMEG